MVRSWIFSAVCALLFGAAAAQDTGGSGDGGEQGGELGYTAPAAKSAQKIDKHTALVLSNKAPLASLGGDHKAIWVYAPSSTDRSVLVYFHGYDAYVTASAAKPDGDFPSWRPARISGDDEREWNAAKEHNLRSQTQTSSYKPVVMLPEVGLANPTPPAVKTCSSGKAPCLAGAWAVTSDGTIARTLDGMIEDAASEAAAQGIETALGQSSGYTHLFLAAHSGGGSVATAATFNTLPRTTATDVWLLDATYSTGAGPTYLALAKAWDDAGLIGPNAGSNPSRLVVVWLSGTATAAAANAIYSALGGWDAYRQKVTWGTADCVTALTTKNFVFIEVPVGKMKHGEVPETVMNQLMVTAAPRATSSPAQPVAPAYEGGDQGGGDQGGGDQGGGSDSGG